MMNGDRTMIEKVGDRHAFPFTSSSRNNLNRNLHFNSLDSSCPSHVLTRIASASGVPAEQLSTVTVLQEEMETFDALVDYASAFSEWRDEPTPLLMTSAKDQDPHESDSDRSMSSSDSDSGYGSDSDSSDEEFPMDQDVEDDVNEMDEKQKEKLRLKKIDAAKIMTKRIVRNIMEPLIGLGYGECLVLWPPPPPVSAKAVSERRFAEICKLRPSSKDEYILLPHFLDASQKDQDKNEAEEDQEKEENNHIEIYICHHLVGDPVATSEEVSHPKKISVVSAARPSKLRDFLKQIVKWNRLRQPFHLPRPRNTQYLSLARYKLQTDGEGFWEHENDRRSRPMSSVILPEGQMKTIVGDIRQFLNKNTRKWYVKHGLPQRRSYLFYGPPGTGKTSTIRVIASHFGRQCCFLNMSSAKFNNQSLADALESLPCNALLVIEDIDALFTNRKSNSSHLTFSGLLNALDGVLSVDGVITVMTTNHIERLDQALLRAGRIDRRFYFGMPDKNCVSRLFKSFYPDAGNELAEKFAENVWKWKDEKIARSIATLQQLFILKRESTAEQCVVEVIEFFETYFPRGVDIKQEYLEKEEREEKEKEKKKKEKEKKKKEKKSQKKKNKKNKKDGTDDEGENDSNDSDSENEDSNESDGDDDLDGDCDGDKSDSSDKESSDKSDDDSNNEDDMDLEDPKHKEK